MRKDMIICFLRKSIALLLLLSLIPVLLLVGALIKSESRGPVVFRDRRIGKGGKEFFCYKFRTMHNKQRTKIGLWLSRHAIDEIAQLWNITQGEMNFFGPRPLSERDYDRIGSHKAIPAERFAEWKKRRLEIKPGMLSPACLSNSPDYEDIAKVDLDLKYLDRMDNNKYLFFFHYSIFFESIFSVIFLGKHKVNLSGRS